MGGERICGAPDVRSEGAAPATLSAPQVLVTRWAGGNEERPEKSLGSPGLFKLKAGQTKV